MKPAKTAGQKKVPRDTLPPCIKCGSFVQWVRIGRSMRKLCMTCGKVQP